MKHAHSLGVETKMNFPKVAAGIDVEPPTVDIEIKDKPTKNDLGAIITGLDNKVHIFLSNKVTFTKLNLFSNLHVNKYVELLKSKFSWKMSKKNQRPQKMDSFKLTTKNYCHF